MFVYGGGRAMLVYGGVVLGFIIFFFLFRKSFIWNILMCCDIKIEYLINDVL